MGLQCSEKTIEEEMRWGWEEIGMKCPNCGAENPDYAVFCGKCAGSMKESEQPTGSLENILESERLTQMEPLIQNRFFRIAVIIGGILSAIFGAIFAIAGAYAIAGGSNVTFTINDKMMSAEEGGPIFLVIGVVLLFVGIALRYAYHKEKPARDG